MSGLLKPIHYQRPKGNFSPVCSLAFFPRRESPTPRVFFPLIVGQDDETRAERLEAGSVILEKRSLNIRVSDVHSASVLVGDSSAIHRRFIGDSSAIRAATERRRSRSEIVAVAEEARITDALLRRAVKVNSSGFIPLHLPFARAPSHLPSEPSLVRNRPCHHSRMMHPKREA